VQTVGGVLWKRHVNQLLDGTGVKTIMCIKNITNTLLESKAVSIDVKVGSKLQRLQQNPAKPVTQEVSFTQVASSSNKK